MTTMIHNPTYPCSCTVDKTGNSVSIRYCSVHAAAPDMLAVCHAVIMFHKGGAWTHESWLGLTGQSEATTKSLCDFSRTAIAKAEGMAK